MNRLWRNVALTTGLGALVGLVIAKLGKTTESAPPQPAKPRPTDKPVVEPPPTQKAPCPPSESRVALFGDSYAVGMGAPMGTLADGCGTPYHWSGVVGSGVVKWDQQLWIGKQLELGQPNVVLLSLGGNDFQRADPDNVAAHIDGLLHKIRSFGARPLWISPPDVPFPDKIGVRQMWVQRMGNDWFDSRKLDIPRVDADPLKHPTAAGYKLWADAVWLWMSGKISA